MRINDALAVITGGASGLGLAVARHVVAAGGKVVLLDVQEGADLVMIKPAGPYLDVIRRVRLVVQVPIVAYQVSGEYSLIKAASERGWIDERAAAFETLTGIKRAGADLIITYFAPDMCRWLQS